MQHTPSTSEEGAQAAKHREKYLRRSPRRVPPQLAPITLPSAPDLATSRCPGLATVLSLLGLSATLAGKVMGSGTAAGGVGETLLPLGASAFAIAMGLNVLELLRVDLPSFEGGLDYITSLPTNARAFLLGEYPRRAFRGWLLSSHFLHVLRARRGFQGWKTQYCNGVGDARVVHATVRHPDPLLGQFADHSLMAWSRRHTPFPGVERTLARGKEQMRCQLSGR